jgi:predicted dehydrogenase
MINIGFVGSGKSVHRYHAPFIIMRPEYFKIKTIFSPHAHQSTWARLKQVMYTENEDQLFKDPHIDLIVVACHLKDHVYYAKKALEHHKHVLVEKPFTPTLREAEDLFTLAKAQGCMLECYQNRRYDSDYLTLLDVLAKDLVRDPFELELHFDYARTATIEAIKHADIVDGFLYGHGAHSFDQVVAAFGKPHHVHFDVRAVHPNQHYNDYFDCDFVYDRLKISVKSSYHRINPRPSIVLTGINSQFTKVSNDRQEHDLKLFINASESGFGQDRLEDYGLLSRLENDQRQDERIETIQGDYGRVYDGIYEHLILGQKQRVQAEETLEVMRLLELGAQAYRSHHR